MTARERGLAVREKRREQRREADGTVRIRFSDPQPLEIAGHLVDVSENGFRMAHRFPSLAAGQIVEFSHIEAQGRARVMWNRIVEQRVETGFLVVA
jgi:PilZ domain